MDWGQAQGLCSALTRAYEAACQVPARAQEAACQVLGLEWGLQAADSVRSLNLTQTHLLCASKHLTAPRVSLSTAACTVPAQMPESYVWHMAGRQARVCVQIPGIGISQGPHFGCPALRGGVLKGPAGPSGAAQGTIASSRQSCRNPQVPDMTDAVGLNRHVHAFIPAVFHVDLVREMSGNAETRRFVNSAETSPMGIQGFGRGLYEYHGPGPGAAAGL